MNIIFNIFILLVEALYFYIPLKEIKEIKSNKNKLLLYFGILSSNIISVLIFGSSIFRYILLFLFHFIIISLIQKKMKFLDFYICPILFFIKIIIEFVIFLLLFNKIDYILFTFILEIISILSTVIFNKKYINLYKIIDNKWSSANKFYARYMILITFVSLILFLLFNLIKIKEVF